MAREKAFHPVACALARELSQAQPFELDAKRFALYEKRIRSSTDAQTIAIHLVALALELRQAPGTERAIQQIVDLIAPVLVRSTEGRRALDVLTVGGGPANEKDGRDPVRPPAPAGGRGVRLRRT